MSKNLMPSLIDHEWTSSFSYGLVKEVVLANHFAVFISFIDDFFASFLSKQLADSNVLFHSLELLKVFGYAIDQVVSQRLL